MRRGRRREAGRKREGRKERGGKGEAGPSYASDVGWAAPRCQPVPVMATRHTRIKQPTTPAPTSLFGM